MRSIDEQLRRIESLDTKAGVLIAADGVLAGLLFSRGSLLLAAPAWLNTVAAAALLASLVLALAAFANRRYDTAPTAHAVIRLMSAPEGWLRWRFLGNILDAIRLNGRKLTWKARFLTAALFFLIASVTLLGGYFMYALIAGHLVRT